MGLCKLEECPRGHAPNVADVRESALPKPGCTGLLRKVGVKPVECWKTAHNARASNSLRVCILEAVAAKLELQRGFLQNKAPLCG
jgi:hypothetical protein